MDLPITSLLAALFAIMLVALSFPISLRRIKLRADIGHADDPVLHRRIRAQGNFVEYAPMAVVVVGLMEAAQVGAPLVWSLAGAFALGRVLHAYGMLSGVLPPRSAGMILTYLSFLAGAVVLAITAF